MKLEIPDEDVDLVIRALEHYYAYTVARKAEDGRYRDLAARGETGCFHAATKIV